MDDGKRTYRQYDITPEIANSLISQYGTVQEAAQAIVGRCIGNNGKESPAWRTVRSWIQMARDGKMPPTVYAQAHEDKLNRIAELLERANVPIDAIGRIDSVKLKAWGVHAKDPETGKIVTEGLHSTAITLSPKWEEGPSWPVMQPAKPTIIKFPQYEAAPRIGRTVVVVPDVQCGFYRSLDDPSQLIPIHDRNAIDCALQIVADLQPDQLIHVGDFLDLPEMSRWLQHEEFWRTTQPSIDEGHRILAEFEAAAGPRERREQTAFIAGNHDRRLREYALKNARAAFNLRPAMSTPDDWPDLTVPHLLRFGDLDIEYCGEYPGSEYWITPRLVVRHNPENRNAYEGSVIAGHTHRIRREAFSRRTPSGAQHHTLYEIGCLCRIDDYADKRSLMRTSVPSDRGFIANWTQGLCVVHVDDDENFCVDQIEIHHGRALYRGRVYQAQRGAA
jgi:hypothetical protein